MNEITAGRVVIPKMGRDKGRRMVVLTVEGDYALIADGKLRPIERPKKKRLKHLYPQKEYLDVIQENINNGKRILDAELRKALSSAEDRKEG